jgi:hypothetical protein
VSKLEKAAISERITVLISNISGFSWNNRHRHISDNDPIQARQDIPAGLFCVVCLMHNSISVDFLGVIDYAVEQEKIG